MSENTQNQNPQQEQYSLNDDRRVKVLSPGALVAKRFFRNRLAVVGLSILVAMFVFSFIGGLVSPYGQDEQFFTYTQMSKEFVGVTRNDTMRFVVADGQTVAEEPLGDQCAGRQNLDAAVIVQGVLLLLRVLVLRVFAHGCAVSFL